MINEYEGIIKNILFESETFFIATLETENDIIKIVGEITGVSVNEKLKVSGSWEEHQRFGKQFKVSEWEKVVPKTEEEALEFLSSGIIKGVGRKRAEQIVEKLGHNAISIINEKGAIVLEGIKGIGKKTREEIANSIKENFEVHQIIGQLKQYQVPTSVILKLYQKYGSTTTHEVLRNPYIMTDIRGMGFLRVDEIARNYMGIAATSGFRVSAGIIYTLNHICYTYGHSYIHKEDLITQSKYNLNRLINKDEYVDTEQIEQTIDVILNDKSLVLESDRVYPKRLYKFENNIAKKLSIIRNNNRNGEALPKIDNLIKEYQKEHGFILAEEQKQAIKTMMKEKVMVLTGDAGTGKTTVVKAILSIYRELHKGKLIALCSPTGRASKRLEEATGYEASTIHRLIGYTVEGEPTYHEQNKLEVDFVVVDEFSMADLEITNLLLNALHKETKILFIGDVDQLQSVGVGNVLHDLIDSGVPTVRLTEIFRQAEESQIISNSHRVNRGEPIIVDNTKDDFYFIHKHKAQLIQEYIIKSAKRFMEKGYTLEDILVLSPMYKTDAGVNILNERLRNELNPPHRTKKEITIGNKVFREGDKIIQNINNINKQVFNGEMGIIKSITKEKNEHGKEVDIVICEFDDLLVKYNREEMLEIDLGYAITIHKSQGGESPIVIMPVTMDHYVMLARNLYYTGITRAKEKVVLIGTMEAMNFAIQNNKVLKRNSTLKERIKTEQELLRKTMNL